MNINKIAWKWKGSLTNRPETKYIALHHRAGDGDVESIHSQHCNQGWTGIGYHFYIRKDGSVYEGRPLNKIGAHITKYNSVSVGICFEGNYETEKTMPAAQLKAGKELIAYLKKEHYPNAEIIRHSDLQATACPGKNFPFDAMQQPEETMTVDEAVKIIKNKTGFADSTIQYLLFYKYGEDTVIKLAKAMK